MRNRTSALPAPRACGSRLLALWLLLAAGWALAAEVIPPAPKQYFNAYAGVVSPAAAAEMNAQLEQFERDTSSQVLVAVYPKMLSDSSIEDYTVRVAETWKVGQKGRNNGAVLFVFIQERSMFLQVGYGLEGALPDALAKQIIENEIKPHFRNGNYEAGLLAGVNAILQAVRGEYKGTGRTAASRASQKGNGFFLFLPMLVLPLILLRLARAGRRGRVYRSGGYQPWGGGWGGGGGGGFSGGGWFFRRRRQLWRRWSGGKLVNYENERIHPSAGGG